MIAVKGNREYTITEADCTSFAKEGYDIYDELGNLVRYGDGKEVAFEKYAELVKDYEKLMEENARLSGEVAQLNEKLKEKKAQRSRKKVVEEE